MNTTITQIMRIDFENVDLEKMEYALKNMGPFIEARLMEFLV